MGLNIFKKIKELIDSKNRIKYSDELKKAEKLLDDGKYEEAIKIYEKLEKEGILKGLDYANVAYAYYNIGDFEKALNYVNKALKYKDRPELWFLKGLILYNLKKYDKAYELLAKSAIYIKRSDVYKALGDILVKFEKYEEALENYLKAYKLNNKNLEALYNAGLILLLLNRVEEAYEIFKEIYTKEPKFKNHEIFKEIENFVEIIDNDIFSNIKLGINFLENDKQIEALKEFNKVLEIDKNNDFAYYYKAVVKEDFYEYGLSLENIINSLNIFERSYFYSKKGDILLRLNNLNEALECYEISLLINENNIFAYFGLAYTYYKKGDYENSLKYFDKVLENISSNLSKKIEAILILYSLICKGDITKEAIFYRKALEFLDDYHDMPICIKKMRAYINYKLGNISQAINDYLEILNIFLDKDIIKNVIALYIEIGRIDEALYYAEKYKHILGEDYIEKIKNNKLSIDSPLNHYPTIYFILDEIPYHVSILYKYIHKNPIISYLYAEYIEKYILELVYDNRKKELLKKLIDIVKHNLGEEMYKFMKSPENYVPSNSVIYEIKDIVINLNGII
ncbi:tetratricopeptide repeat protein [Methanocaldococcus indicus]|uniref:tetratricopeptide repeat protein n=1 Tax=Methanocaldococcus indicus TaxID=213231 RepID=UPI003C6CF0ED